MTYKLFLDDLRNPANADWDWVIVRSSEEAMQVLHNHGMPRFISFDHDLGGEDTAIIFILKMIDMCLDDPSTKFPRDYFVHSANPVGAENIRGLMDCFIKFLDDN